MTILKTNAIDALKAKLAGKLSDADIADLIASLAPAPRQPQKAEDVAPKVAVAILGNVQRASLIKAGGADESTVAEALGTLGTQRWLRWAKAEDIGTLMGTVDVALGNGTLPTHVVSKKGKRRMSAAMIRQLEFRGVMEKLLDD